MLLIPLGLVSLLASVGLFAWTSNAGGTQATTTISDQVLTGSMLYGISGLLAVAGILFVLSGLLRAIRKFAVLVAILALVGTGGVAAFLPQSVSSYVGDHCPAQVQSFKACQELKAAE